MKFFVAASLRRYNIVETPVSLFATSTVLLPMLLGALLTLTGCSRIQVVYGSADLLLARYAEDYLELTSGQLKDWKPGLGAVLAEHRTRELPQLAGFFDRALKASRHGFDLRGSTCLSNSLKQLYRSHAQLAVNLATPLLAALDSQQVAALDLRFKTEYEDDRIKPGTNPDHERRKRARRYTKAIEDWTGPLSTNQLDLVARITERMPDTGASVLVYRTKKRQELIALLRAGVGETPLRAFLTEWLVELRDLPPDLERSGGEIEARLAELLTSLGASLDPAQRDQLQSRLSGLRDDMLDLQKQPQIIALNC